MTINSRTIDWTTRSGQSQAQDAERRSQFKYYAGREDLKVVSADKNRPAQTADERRVADGLTKSFDHASGRAAPIGSQQWPDEPDAA